MLSEISGKIVGYYLLPRTSASEDSMIGIWRLIPYFGALRELMHKFYTI